MRRASVQRQPLPVSGTFSLSGFQPTPSYSQLSVGATSSRVALPSGTVVVVYNTGSNAAYVTLGGSSVAATTADDVIQPNSWMAFTVGSNAYLAAIETAGGTALNISGGSGLPTGAGAGGGGAITSPLGSSTPDSAGVAVTFAGTPPTGFSNPCAGAVGSRASSTAWSASPTARRCSRSTSRRPTARSP